MTNKGPRRVAILGHQSLTMTMRYAHLAPEHLQEVRALNPLAQLETGTC